MKKVFLLALTAAMFITQSCQNNDCDPGVLPTDDLIYVNILNPNGTSYIKYTGGVLPDSVKVFNLNTGLQVSTSLLKDSILNITGYNTGNNVVTNFKISKGTVLKPDTVTVTVGRKDVEDNCGNLYNVARFAQIKANNVVKCTACNYNTAYNIQR
jgi:hypothetical protein